MRNIGNSFRVIAFSLIIFGTGCAHCNAYDEDQMYTLASALTKLSAAVEAKVLFNEAPDLKDKELIDLSTSHDSRLKEPFDGFLLKARSQNGHAIVLVCSKDGRKALLEDGTCTTKFDYYWWKDQPDRPCEISTLLCPAKQE